MNSVSVTLFLLALILALAASTLTAAEPAKLIGTIAITEDKDWNITAIAFTAEDGTVYQVVLDEIGRKLGSEEDGLKVELTATVAEKDDAKWLTVSAYKELTEK